VFAAYGLAKPAALNGPQFLKDSLLTAPIRVAGGAIEVPPGAGLGIEVAEARLGEYAGPGRS
jgi:L-alanine-DL-glutamate epimerase-like enolase superfamily enzyme